MTACAQAAYVVARDAHRAARDAHQAALVIFGVAQASWVASRAVFYAQIGERVDGCYAVSRARDAYDAADAALDTATTVLRAAERARDAAQVAR